MIVATLCQSCGIPLDNQQLKGTEANGLKRMIIVFCYDGHLSNQV
jgi:predicted amidophosphoribosyltransferase